MQAILAGVLVSVATLVALVEDGAAVLIGVKAGGLAIAAEGADLGWVGGLGASLVVRLLGLLFFLWSDIQNDSVVGCNMGNSNQAFQRFV